MKFLLAKAALFSTQSYDVVLLQELWMRPDHETIRSRLPAGYWMSGEVREGTAGDWLFHLQRLETWLPQISVTAEFSPHSAPASPSSQTFPSSKIVFSRLCRLFQINAVFPVLKWMLSIYICHYRDFSFTSFSVHGNFWSGDGEYWARKGIGRVRLEPAVNFTVDIFLSSLCAEDSNTYYRQIQAAEFGEALRNSDADFVLGNLSFVLRWITNWLLWSPPITPDNVLYRWGEFWSGSEDKRNQLRRYQ